LSSSGSSGHMGEFQAAPCHCWMLKAPTATTVACGAQGAQSLRQGSSQVLHTTKDFVTHLESRIVQQAATWCDGQGAGVTGTQA
jgi:hypothetical protein